MKDESGRRKHEKCAELTYRCPALALPNFWAGVPYLTGKYPT